MGALDIPGLLGKGSLKCAVRGSLKGSVRDLQWFEV